ncbi:MAG: DUF5710 domain-containing protein [Propionibacteriaceae bacterium]
MTDYLDVPYAEKDDAKAFGARWDPAARSWYAPDTAAMRRLARWRPKPTLPEVLPGEGRGFGSGLFVDLVPRSCWFTNVRHCVAKSEWDRVRRMVYGRAEDRCEVCQYAPARGRGELLEAHERWAFDDATLTQRLVRLIALCSGCHEATHFGHAQLKGRAGEAFLHLMRVTGMDEHTASEHIDEALRTWRSRSARDWVLDLSMLLGAGIELAPPPEAETRRGIADRHRPDRLN